MNPIDEKNLVPGMDESTGSDLESLSEHIGKLHLFIYNYLSTLV